MAIKNKGSYFITTDGRKFKNEWKFVLLVLQIDLSKTLSCLPRSHKNYHLCSLVNTFYTPKFHCRIFANDEPKP